MVTISDWVAMIGYLTCLVLALPAFVSSVTHDTNDWDLLNPLLGFALVLTLNSQQLSNSLRLIAFLGAVGAYMVAKSLKRSISVLTLRVLGAVIGAVAFQDAAMNMSRARTLGNPNMIAGILVLCWPWWRAWQWEMVMIGGFIGTGSRGGILASLIALIAARRQALPAGRKWRKSAAVLVGILLAAVTVGLISYRPETLAKRWAIWGEAWGLFMQRPWFGWGSGSYGNLAQVEPFKAHADNALLTVLAELGLTGLAAWLWLLWSVGRKAWRSQSPARWAILAWALMQLVDDTLAWPWVAICWGLNLALL